MAAHISFVDVKKSFDEKVVLDGISFSIERGECLTIIGGSGCGKSVSLKCLLGLLQADAGHIWMDGVDLFAAPASVQRQLRSQIGVLFQNAALFDSLTVLDNVAFGLLQNGVPYGEAKRIALEKLKRVNLDEKIAFLYPEALSGGMRKRVGIARAIATEPKVILFDEPTSGLDPIMSDVISNLILQCMKETGATALVITHDMISCQKISNHIVMLYQGKIAWAGSREELETTDNPYLRQFVRGQSTGPIVV